MREHGRRTRRGAGRGPTVEKLDAGQKVRNVSDNNIGVVLDFACQYAHPKAQPVYSYLIRWQDGQVQALSEVAFSGSHGYELVD